eukprot:1544604-Prorocentrum_lima.AAC.1
MTMQQVVELQDQPNKASSQHEGDMEEEAFEGWQAHTANGATRLAHPLLTSAAVPEGSKYMAGDTQAPSVGLHGA